MFEIFGFPFIGRFDQESQVTSVIILIAHYWTVVVLKFIRWVLVFVRGSVGQLKALGINISHNLSTLTQFTTLSPPGWENFEGFEIWPMFERRLWSISPGFVICRFGGSSQQLLYFTKRFCITIHDTLLYASYKFAFILFDLTQWTIKPNADHKSKEISHTKVIEVWSPQINRRFVLGRYKEEKSNGRTWRYNARNWSSHRM